MTVPDFHPTFAALIAKLKDVNLSIRDAWPERNAWHKAGCPIEKVDTKPETEWETAYRCYEAPRALSLQEVKELLHEGQAGRREMEARFARMERVEQKYDCRICGQSDCSCCGYTG